MAGMGSHVLSHVVRRGLATSPSDFMNDVSVQHAKGAHPEVNHFALFSAALVLLFTFLVIASVDYTVSNVMAALAMIETDSTTTVCAAPSFSKAKESDGYEKEPLLEEEADIEVVALKSKPITSSIKTTIKHLHRVGGFRARWRGFGQGMLYTVSVGFVGHAIGALLCGGQSLAVPIVGGMIATTILCRLHMLWTHAMIAMPTTVPWYRRFVARKESRVVLLPSFIFAITSQLWTAAPILIGVGIYAHAVNAPQRPLLILFELVAGLAVYLLFTFFVALPVAATLFRVEACLLPEEHETIVPFDRQTILGSIDLTIKGAPGQLFKSAWKSVSFASRIRVMKMYVKLFFIELTLCLSGAMLATGILYTTGQLWVIAMMTYPMWEPQF